MKEEERSVWKQLLFHSITFLVLGCCLMFVVSTFHLDITGSRLEETGAYDNTVSAKEKWKQEEGSYLQCEKRVDILKKVGKYYIQIRKPQNTNYSVRLEDCYQEKRVRLYLYGVQKQSLSFDDLEVVCQGKNKKKIYECFQTGTSISYEEQSEKKSTAILSFQVDKIYGYCLYEDSKYIYLACKNPKEVYNKIIVLDAGHGGKDTGTDAVTGNWPESYYNLDFVKKIEEQWSEKDGKVYITRWNDKRCSLQSRVRFANSVSADYFISIHCNSSDEAGGSGLEALYKSNQYKEESKQMAQICLEELTKATGMTNRGALNGQEIFIIRKAKMPTVLLEMGFLTSREDVIYLQSEDNRVKMAKTVCNAIRKGMSTIK